MRNEEGPAPWEEQPAPCPAKDNHRSYTQNRRKSTLCGCEFTGRTILVLVAFAAWLACIIGAIVLMGYGVMLGLRAMAGIDADILACIGYAVIASFIIGVAWIAIRE